MNYSEIKSVHYHPQEYLEIQLRAPLDPKQHVYYLNHPDLLNGFVHLSEPTIFYFDTQSFVSLQHYLVHHSISQDLLKQWLLGFLAYGELDEDGIYLVQTDQVFIDEQTQTLKFCKVPITSQSKHGDMLCQLGLNLIEAMDFEGDQEWVSQLYWLLKQKPVRIYLIKQFLTTKKSKKWFSFFRKEEEDELSDFFKMMQVKESQPFYGMSTTPFETQVLMAGYQYGYLVDERKQHILISGSPWVMGRNADCHYVLNYPEISKSHCSLFIEEGVCYLEDLGSTNGTYLNEQKLLPHTKEAIKNGDEIRLANLRYQYHV